MSYFKSKAGFMDELKKHPLYNEALKSCKDNDEKKALELFMEDFGGHIGIFFEDVHVKSEENEDFLEEVRQSIIGGNLFSGSESQITGSFKP
jgi:ribosomal protein L20A (L18A)